MLRILVSDFFQGRMKGRDLLIWRSLREFWPGAMAGRLDVAVIQPEGRNNIMKSIHSFNVGRDTE
jgi:hypothetical protein